MTKSVNTLDAFYDFEWSVAPDYEWQDWLDEQGTPIVVPADGLHSLESPTAVEWAWQRRNETNQQVGPLLSAVLGDVGSLRRYPPMGRDHAALHKEFSEVDYTSPGAIRAFASRYGHLGVPHAEQSLTYQAFNGEWRTHDANGEPFLDWAFEICQIREGLKLSRKHSAHPRRWRSLFQRGLQHLRGDMSSDPAGRPRLRVGPVNLIGALWFQLALSVAADKRFEACKVCRRLFEISTERTGYRRHRKFCSASCKTKDYRERKRTALSLSVSGESIKTISDTTMTKRATVRDWLAAARQRRRQTR